MPSRALTVTLNYDHSRNFVFLLPALPDSSKDLSKRILREGRNKFRVKSLMSVFLQGGLLLLMKINFRKARRKYGSAKASPTPDHPRISKDVTPRMSGLLDTYPFPFVSEITSTDRFFHLYLCNCIFLDRSKSHTDENAVKQLMKVASLPGVRVTVGMPDLHPGNRFPIGGRHHL